MTESESIFIVSSTISGLRKRVTPGVESFYLEEYDLEVFRTDNANAAGEAIFTDDLDSWDGSMYE